MSACWTCGDDGAALCAERDRLRAENEQLKRREQSYQLRIEELERPGVIPALEAERDRLRVKCRELEGQATDAFAARDLALAERDRLREALREIALIGTDVAPAAAGGEASFYRAQLGTAIGIAARALAGPAKGEG